MKSIIGRFIRMVNRKRSEHFEIYFGGNKTGRNVLIFTENINATYFISFDIPMRRMHARGEVNVATVSQKFVNDSGKGCWESWSDIFKPDVVIMTRYGEPFGSEIINFFKGKKIPIIYHIDDDLLDLPESLGDEIRSRQGALVEARSYLLSNSDLVYSSTSHLAKILKTRFPHTRITHGHMYAPYLRDLIKFKKKDDSLQADDYTEIIGYMGSKGHQEDLELVVPALERLLKERPNLRFEVFGTIKMPDRLKKFTLQVKSHSVQTSYIGFLSELSSLGWDIGLAPLVDEPFNLCKAPTKYIEYTASRIPSILSNLPVYSDIVPKNGGVLVDNDWYQAIKKVLDSKADRLAILEESERYCEEKFSISKLENQLFDIFESTLS